TLQGAVSADDESLLKDADKLRDQLVAKVGAGAAIIAQNGGDPTALLAAFERYYEAARKVSVGMIAGHGGEDMVAQIELMRAVQEEFAKLLDHTTTPDHARMAAAFDAARSAQRRGLQIDGLVALAAFAIMLLLSSYIVRGTVRALGAVASGVQRFARGD